MALERIDRQAITASGDQPAVICPVRNEIAFTPPFLKHYRAMGVRRFIFIDNGSHDGTRELLCAQPDCVVYATDESYRASHYARDWINRIIAEVGYEGWLIYADVDEHLVFRGMDRAPVQAFCAEIEAAGADTVFAAMIDMYADAPPSAARPEAGRRLYEAMPWFDSEYVMREWPRRPWDRGTRSFLLQVLGGPRCRLLSSLEAERRKGALFATFANQVDRFVDRVPAAWLPSLAAVWPRELTAQQKMPINRVRAGFRYANSHSGSNKAFANELVALLHFKFCAELQQRFTMVTAEANHYRRGLPYLQLREAIGRWGDRSLVYEGSRRYTGSGDLLAEGLIGPAVAALWQGGGPREVVTGRGSLSTPSRRLRIA